MKIKHVSFIAALFASAGFIVLGSQASADLVKLDYGSRHSENGGEFNAKSTDFNPTTMGYSASATFNGGFETILLGVERVFQSR